MYISNLDNKNKRYYECGTLVGKYLIKKGIPMLSRKGKHMLFSKTKGLQEAIDKMPFYLQVLVKAGVING